jgi:hypothetical protein
MQDVGNVAEWVGSVATAVSVLVAMVVFYVATRESQRQNRLNWKPHLVFDRPAIDDDESGVSRIGASNIGKGPALECRYIAYVNGNFYRARAFAIGAEQSLQNLRCAIRLRQDDDAKALEFCHSALDDLIASNRHRSWEAVLCSDIFGTRWRFVRGRPYPNGPLPPDERVRSGWWCKWRSESADGEWVQRARKREAERAGG